MDEVTDEFKQVQLWHVRGVTGEFYTTKLAAEVRARAAFPEDSPDRRYARVFYRRFFEEV